MLRCYKVGTLAVVIFVSAAASQVTGAQLPTSVQPEAQRMLPSDRVASTTAAPAKQADVDTGCPEGQDNRRSELCAQWKAADAAAGSLTAAWWSFCAGVVGLIVGALTLFFASRAAHWAKEAAHHTETGAKEAKKSADIAESALADARRASRPQLTAGVGFYKGVETVENYWPRCQLNIGVRNSGDVTARNVSVHHVRVSLSNGRFNDMLLWSQQGSQFRLLEPGGSSDFGPFLGDDFIFSREDILNGSLIGLMMTAKLCLNVTDRLGIARQYEEVWSGVVHEVFDGPIIRVNFEREAQTQIDEPVAPN